MENILQIGLPIYFIIYFSIIFLLKTLNVSKKIGKSPIVFPTKDETAYAIIGQYFKYTIIGVFLYVLSYSIFSNLYESFLPMKILEIHSIKIIGILFLFISLIWTIIAQNNMKNSWRIGIDEETIIKADFSDNNKPLSVSNKSSPLPLTPFETPLRITLGNIKSTC